MTNKNRKSYLNLKSSLIEFFDAPVRYIKESNTKESAFEKPYESPDYPTMHFDIPEPDWPTWNFDTSRRRYPPEEGVGTGKHCKGCILSAYTTVRDCETDSVQFYSSARCVSKKSGFFPPPAMGRTSTGGFGFHGWGNTSLVVWAVKGAILDVALDWFAGARPGIEVFVDPEIEEHVLIGKMIDDLGNVCMKTVEVSCEPALTTYTNVRFNAEAAGYNATSFGYNWEFNWAQVRAGENLTTIKCEEGVYEIMYARTLYVAEDPQRDVRRGWWKIPLNLTSEAIITGCRLYIYRNAMVGTEGNLMLFGSNATFPLTTSDWNEFEADELCDTPLIQDSVGYGIFTLNQDGLDWLTANKEGTATFCIREYDHDVSDVDPIDTGGQVFTLSFDVTKKPRLFLDYQDV